MQNIIEKAELSVMKINAPRLIGRLQELAKIGMNTRGGIDRQLASPADEKTRKWLVNCWTKELDLNLYIDPIANIWARQKTVSERLPIVIGSHHDTVPNGGGFDGALGVLIATEIMQIIQENLLELKHPLEIVSFTGEEPNSFSVSTLGSKVLCGRLTYRDLQKLYDKNTGETLEHAVSRLGGDISKVGDAVIKKNSLAAFVECHIEQGRRLYDKNQAVASVTCITGIYRETIRVIGEANHAGTTQIQNRRDALAAAAEVCLAVENIMKQPNMTEVSATVGRVEVLPNSSNIIPGEVTLTLDLRTADPVKRSKVLQVLTKAIDEIMVERKLQIVRNLDLDQPEMQMDKIVIDSLNEAILFAGETKRQLVSMAGHDAANMARVTKAGMLFVQSIDGYSHCPKEMTGNGEIVKAAQILLDTILILDRSLK